MRTLLVMVPDIPAQRMIFRPAQAEQLHLHTRPSSEAPPLCGAALAAITEAAVHSMSEKMAGNEQPIEKRLAALEEQNRVLMSLIDVMRAEARLTRSDVMTLERICANFGAVTGKARSEALAVRLGLAELAARTALRLTDPQHFMTVLEAGIDEAVQRITASRHAETPLESEQLEEILSTVDDLRDRIRQRFADLASPSGAPPRSGLR